MVAANPHFIGQSSNYLNKFKATVFNDIWPEVLFFTLVSTVVVLVSELTSTSLAISNQLLTVLGIVLGLVISFRTTTAYERFSEGRRLWTSLAIGSRNLAQIIWIYVPEQGEKQGEKQSHLDAVIEKKSMINLIQAYSVSVMHLLRGEAGPDLEDLHPLISFLPRYAIPDSAEPEDTLPLWVTSNSLYDEHEPVPHPYPVSMATSALYQNTASTMKSIEKVRKVEVLDAVDVSDLESGLPVSPNERPRMSSQRRYSHSIVEYFPILRTPAVILSLLGCRRQQRESEIGDERPVLKQRRTFTGKKVKHEAADSNVPLEITLVLMTYFYSLTQREPSLVPAVATAMVNAIAFLQDTVVHLQRIKTTPIPFAYQVHLKFTLWMYLFFLPFQIYAQFTWLTIPCVAFTSLLLLGFLEIGQEIEDPFDGHVNDLDLEGFCLAIKRDLHEITAHTSPHPATFVYSSRNKPFAPADMRNAERMKHEVQHPYHNADSGIHHIQRTLLRSWREVESKARSRTL